MIVSMLLQLSECPPLSLLLDNSQRLQHFLLALAVPVISVIYVKTTAQRSSVACESYRSCDEFVPLREERTVTHISRKVPPKTHKYITNLNKTVTANRSLANIKTD
jgi:hypothetical protein